MNDQREQLARGHVWLVEFDPVRGHEQGGTRPCLLISTNAFNRGPADLVIVLPITRINRHNPAHVSVEPPEGGLRDVSYIKCEDIRSIARGRLRSPWGAVSDETMEAVTRRLRRLLEL